MSGYSIPVRGLSAAITAYRANAASSAEHLSAFLYRSLNDRLLENDIRRAFGSQLHKISISPRDLVDEVRQEIIMESLKAVLKDIKVASDGESFAYIRRICRTAASDLVSLHLGYKLEGGGRSKGLFEAPTKWESRLDEDSSESDSMLTQIESRLVGDEIDPAEQALYDYMGSLEERDPTKHQIMALRLAGYTQKEIAEKLGLTDKTVRNHYRAMEQALRNRLVE